MIVNDIKQTLSVLALPEKALFFPRFFKTGLGEYGEGDLFLGVKVPDQRLVAKEFSDQINLEELSILLTSTYHEERLTALFILVSKFEKSKKNKDLQQCIVDFYLAHLDSVNNWDLVDSSCYKILGRFAYEQNRDDLLIDLSFSDQMWHKRIAVVGSLFYIKKKRYDVTKELVVRNMKHPHDLMHKANGWMLREMGNVNEAELITFLNRHYKEMPRTTLRYAIEKLDEDLRQDFLKSRI